ncbi:MAG TPA: hypothetical protein VKU85_12200 [bacterium]|nr:hypothetical protein [bacterium]
MTGRLEAIIVLAAAVVCVAATRHVPGEYPTIPGALGASAAGDTVVVGPGTYVGPIELERSVTLMSSGGAAVTTLDADGAGYCVYASDELVGSLVEGFTFIGADDGVYGWDGFAFGGEGEMTLADCVVGVDNATRMGIANVFQWDVTIRNVHQNPPGHPWNANVNMHGYGTLTVEDCRFEFPAYVGAHIAVHNPDAMVVVRSCEFFGPGGVSEPPSIAYSDFGQVATIVVEDNLFFGGPPAVGHYVVPIQAFEADVSGGLRFAPTIELRRNTFVENDPPLGDLPVGPWTGVFEQNVVTGGQIGVWIPGGGAGYTVACNNVYGNAQNWDGIPDPTGTNGNISQDPLYCEPPAGDYSVQGDSPCLPANNSCGVILGAFGQGCAATALERDSWGRLKARFRAPGRR